MDFLVSLAPMAGIADRAYRTTARRYGADCTTSEMISAKGLTYGDEKTAALCSTAEKDAVPYGIQLFGAEPEFMQKAVIKLQEIGSNPDFIDLNMGCPVPKVTGTGAGAALMRTPETAAEIVRACVAVSHVPITVKMRIGWDLEHINALEFAQLMEEAGASALTVHGRTKVQGYSGKVNLNYIWRVKASVKIPVIGNGDISSPEEAKLMRDFTGVDGIAVGRGSYGSPWIFTQIKDYLKNGEYAPAPPIEERLEIMSQQVKLAVSLKGEHTAMREARTQCAFYLKGFPGAANFRKECSELTRFEDLEEIVGQIITQSKEIL
ncbi:MAG: tRNA dihydrouridine synthase DusB [Ruminococcus sp.]|nr:tRNA dihydrouridine synthase DusB [Ruminococcus sp.]